MLHVCKLRKSAALKIGDINILVPLASAFEHAAKEFGKKHSLKKTDLCKHKETEDKLWENKKLHLNHSINMTLNSF